MMMINFVRTNIKVVIAVLTTSTLAILLVGVWLQYQSKAIHLPAGWVHMKAADAVQRCPQYLMVMTLKMDLVISPHFNYNASNKGLEKREQEYMTALQRNLNHDFVRRIHLLTPNAEEVTQRLEKFKLSNRSKLLITELKRIERTRDVFEYISRNLVGINVMYLNGDIYLGSGFEGVDPSVMCENRIMYALTRRIRKEETCEEEDWCVDILYQGSHDAFLFHLTEPFPESALAELDFPYPSLGMDNVIIWVFETQLNYCILNPCSILEVFHLHCTALRNYNFTERVNNDINTGLSPFTYELFCNSTHQGATVIRRQSRPKPKLKRKWRPKKGKGRHKHSVGQKHPK